MDDRAAKNRLHRKARDRSLVLLLLGIVLLLPPVASIAEVDGKIWSLPVTMVYLFSIWAGLILGCALLSKTLADSPDRYRRGGKG